MVKIEKIIKKHHDGALLNLFVTTQAKSAIFPAGVNFWRNSIEIKVCSPAQDNKANKEVIKTVADFFDKPARDVFIVSGDKNKNKTVLVKGATVDFISDKLRESLNGL